MLNDKTIYDMNQEIRKMLLKFRILIKIMRGNTATVVSNLHNASPRQDFCFYFYFISTMKRLWNLFLIYKTPTANNGKGV